MIKVGFSLSPLYIDYKLAICNECPLDVISDDDEVIWHVMINQGQTYLLADMYALSLMFGDIETVTYQCMGFSLSTRSGSSPSFSYPSLSGQEADVLSVESLGLNLKTNYFSG